MESTNSQYEIELIAALLRDIQNAHGLVFTSTARRLTLQKIRKRVLAEGIGFLTRTMPRLAKAFDRTLSGGPKLTAVDLGFKPKDFCKYPQFLGELFGQVLDEDGNVLQSPCVESVKTLRNILYLFYKYELPYSETQEQQVIDKFKGTEDELTHIQERLREIEARLEQNYLDDPGWRLPTGETCYRRLPDDALIKTVRGARILLNRVFASFDPKDVTPRHGPGAVATRQLLWEKYQWTNISARITDLYPLDEYYYASLGHVCDAYDTFECVGSESLPARVVLVPKDSRGPRLISCEPVDYQWIQQGLGRSIVEWVERHPLTKWMVHFTDQGANQRGALLGSLNGAYATLDLNEASDRVSLDLVRLLFPKHVYTYLEACRTASTVLPDGTVLPLKKFAPMGSCLCFPILALTVWAILTASSCDADTIKRAKELDCGILVYGDDVIVPTAQAANAIEQLESFGLKVNRDKSCTGGLFRESCGTDAFQGVDVTPVRLRTVWSSAPRPETFASWVSYANSFYDRKCFNVYEYIVERLYRIYGPIPDDSLLTTAPSIRETLEGMKLPRRRWNRALQKVQYHCLELKSPVINKEIDGWSMLLRFFTEGASDRARLSPSGTYPEQDWETRLVSPSFSAGQYTRRRISMLVRRWR